MWSIGCIFAELMLKEPLFQGKGELDQIAQVRLPNPGAACLRLIRYLTRRPPLVGTLQIFKTLGHPTEASWPGWTSLPLAKSLNSSGQQSVFLYARLNM